MTGGSKWPKKGAAKFAAENGPKSGDWIVGWPACTSIEEAPGMAANEGSKEGAAAAAA